MLNYRSGSCFITATQIHRLSPLVVFLKAYPRHIRIYYKAYPEPIGTALREDE